MNTLTSFDGGTYAVTASADPVSRLVTLSIGCLSMKSTFLFESGATSDFSAVGKLGVTKEVTIQRLGSTGNIMLSRNDASGSWAIVRAKDLNALIAAAIKASKASSLANFDVYYPATRKYSRVRPCSGLVARNATGWPKGFTVEPKYKDALVVLLDKNGKQGGAIRDAATVRNMTIVPLSRG